MNFILKCFALCSIIFIGTSINAQVSTFNYTGSVQTFVVPPGVTSLQIETYGAAGGDTPVGFGFGGFGGYVIGEFAVTPGETLNIYVGGQGGVTGAPGYNGGGTGSSSPGGGGASDVRQAGTALANRIIVAGGGGGAAYETAWSSGWGVLTGTADGGQGGGLIGTQGLAWQNPCQGGTGGTQVAGGAQGGTLGIGGNGSNSPGDTGGGGGGYYGGGGGGDCTGYNGAGGGGSGYTIPSAINVSHTTGSNSGNGLVVITLLCNPLTTSVSNTTICDGEQVTLSASGSGNITWDNGVVNNIAFNPPIGTTTYTATSDDVNECNFTVDITVNTVPTVDAGLDVTMCSGITDTTLTATGTADTFTWNNGIMDGVQFTPTAGVTTYIVTAEYTASGCQATDTLVLTAGNPSISLSASDEMLGNDGTITLVINSGQAPYTFDWDNDGTGDNDDTQNLSGIASGSYTVVMTDASGCTTTETIFVGSQVGIDELNSSIKVYPNPTMGLINIEIPGLFEYEVINTLGQIVEQGSASDEKTINLSSFENGMFTLRIVTDKNTSIVSIVKQ